MNIFDDEDFQEDVDVKIKKAKVVVQTPFDEFVKKYIFQKNECSLDKLDDIYRMIIDDVNTGKESYDKRIVVCMSPSRLKIFLTRAMKYFGKDGNYNWIDTSNCNSFMDLFNCLELSEFNGDISRWDTSNVTNMMGTFKGCSNFNGDISGWDVSKVKFINNNTFKDASQNVKEQILKMKSEKRFISRNPKLLW